MGGWGSERARVIGGLPEGVEEIAAVVPVAERAQPRGALEGGEVRALHRGPPASRGGGGRAGGVGGTAKEVSKRVLARVRV